MLEPTEFTALIVAAGRGTRVGGDTPKQWRDLAGLSVLAHSVAAFDSLAKVVLVVHPDDEARAADAFPDVSLVTGGATRGASVAAGLGAVQTRYVLIHDGARPLISRTVITNIMDALRDGASGAAPALAVTDALWRGDTIVGSIEPRDGLWRAQTPQGFVTQAIKDAHSAADGAAADDVEVALAAGLEVAIVPGDEDNLKITREEDFSRAEKALAPDVRVGNGYDVHRFGEGDHVTLCGVTIPHGRGLQGHSDADVGLHVLCDALYGALAEGDIGRHFPPSEAEWKGADSAVFLRHAAGLARTKGYRLSALDVTLICEEPKIGPHADAMRARVSEIAGVAMDRISVKATTTERLGFAGRGEGIAALATATLIR